MAQKEIQIECTEDKYCSRSEMQKKLSFPVSDLLWKKVTDYRSTFNRSISLKWMGNRSFCVCVYPTFASKVNQIEGKFNRLISEYNNLDKANGDFKYFKISCLKSSLLEIAKSLNFTIAEDRLSKLIVSENPFDTNEDRLVNYINALRYIEEKYVNNVDVDFLAELYSRVSGNPELTSFYRERDEINVNSLALVSRIYEFAPCEYIEPLMESLFEFIQNSNISVLQKAMIAYCYINMVRPFNDYNEEISVLIAKAVLAHCAYGESATLVNLEILNNIKRDSKQKINNEVQQYSDLTYALCNYVGIIDDSITATLAILREYNLKELKNDFYKADEPIAVTSEKNETKTEVYTSVETKKVEEVTPKVEEIKSVKEVEKAPSINDKKEEINDTPRGIAVNYIPPVLDEKTASRLEQHLLEMDVCLKKGEAYFYARHCTLGMYYTIDQYKKNVKCVYETARTSMEHLVELGYYSKKQVGKKFVYTPIERK